MMGMRGPKPKTQAERFFTKCASAPSGCIEWLGGRFSNGYGAFHPGPSAMADGAQKKILAHRWSYEHTYGEVPDGLQLDHTCRNRACVNPEHLEPVTAKENQRRSARARITQCPHGHKYDAENTRLDKHGRRSCWTCIRERERARAESKNAKRRAARRAKKEGSWT